jgi:hypothetical protein
LASFKDVWSEVHCGKWSRRKGAIGKNWQIFRMKINPI